MLTVMFNIPTLYIFITILMPNQEKQAKFNFDDVDIVDTFGINKFWHLVVLPILGRFGILGWILTGDGIQNAFEMLRFIHVCHFRS